MKLVFVCVWLGLMFFRLKPPIGLPLVVWTRLMLSLPNKQLSISARQIKFISVAILTGRYLFKTAGPSSNLASQMFVLGVVKKMDFCIGLGFCVHFEHCRGHFHTCPEACCFGLAGVLLCPWLGRCP